MTVLFDSERNPATAARLPDISVWAQQPGVIDALLQLFRDQSSAIRSIVAIDHSQACGGLGRDAHITTGMRAFLIRHAPNKHATSWVVRHMPLRSPGGAHPCDGLAQQARDLLSDAPGNDLLLCSAQVLNGIMTPLVDDFSFQAVVVLSLRTSACADENDGWKLRRSLFDRGLICIGSVQIAGCTALGFLNSAAVRSLRGCHVGSRGHVTMSELTNGGRFANQLFRYAYVKLYALRHGLVSAFPDWDGNQLFGLEETSCVDMRFRRLSFNGFTDNDRLLWDENEPPIDVDLNGYFQEIPACWRKHRPFLRRLFQLAPEHQNAIERWWDHATRLGQRTVVAIHVRRGDYRQNQQPEWPWFRLVPVDWYLDLLHAIWPTLRDPVLFVATDEPDTIRPLFAKFETISVDFHSVQQLPTHVLEFEILRRADYLAICNSSFSRLAAILAPATQECFLPSFESQSFVRYEPWIDPAFWARFANAWYARPALSEDPRHGPLTTNGKTSGAPADAATIYVDVSDLVFYLLDHTTLSGIQRVQCEIISRLPEVSGSQTIRLVVLNDVGGLCAIDKSALLKIVQDIGSEAASRDLTASMLRELRSCAKPCVLEPSDIFLIIGAFWGVAGIGSLLQDLKNIGVVIGVFFHDILPITAREYFEARDIRVFIKNTLQAFTFADFILTTSKYNKESLITCMAGQRMEPLPVHLVPLGDELAKPQPTDRRSSSVVAEIISKDYVLCVGTIEVRKNPIYLFNIWKLMVRAERANIPTLVFAGRKGWLVRDFMDQLKACNYLGGRIVLVHDVTDGDLDLLYRNCMFTMFPSFAEGWGLPVGESLAHGKICICSAAGAIPEVGGKLLDYIDPYNVSGGLELVLRYIDDPKRRRAREDDIGRQFEARPWQKVTDDFLSSTQALARQVRQSEVTAIRLPPNRFLPISADPAAISFDGIDGALSADLACIRGWQAPQIWGVRATGIATVLRFRADAPVGARINLILRLTTPGSKPFVIRISSACGAQTLASVKGGADSLAVLPCEVGSNQLVTVRLSLADPWLYIDEVRDAQSWCLKGFLYFESKRLADKAIEGSRGPPCSKKPLTASAVNSRGSTGKRLLLPQVAVWDNIQRASSFGAFSQAPDCYWESDFTDDRKAPIFADQTDMQTFYSGCGNPAFAPRVGEINDSIRLVRRSDQFVSMSRFTEGSIFDRSGVWRALGYLQTSPPEFTPWLTKNADGLWLDGEALAAAPRYEKSHLIFYNGNLHNYYHWLVEGLLSLDVISRAMGIDSGLRIALPKSMDIDAVFDHRGSLKAVGLDKYVIVEVAENLINVQEVIWVHSDSVQSMPAPYVKDFQRRVAARYAGLSGPRNRRLFIARRGSARTIKNIEQVQAFLSTYGFETVYLEGKSVVDQILLFQEAQFVIGAHGAGLSNLLFCEPGTKVIEFMPSIELRPFFWLISQKLDLVHGIQFCTPVETPHFQSALTVDINKLQVLFRMVDAHSN